MDCTKDKLPGLNGSPTVFTWGTFDRLHEGHKQFLKRVKQFGKLYVIVIPSQNKFENCGYYPVKNEIERKKELLHFGQIENEGLIEDVFIDCFNFGLKSILKVRPDIFCFGYDQDIKWTKRLMNFIESQEINTTFIQVLNEKNGNGIHSRHL